MARKPLRNTSAFAPITPTPPDPQPSGQLTRDEACQQVLDLRHILSAERKRHSLSEKALTKYIDILEKQIFDLTETFSLLGRPLIPTPLGRAARRH